MTKFAAPLGAFLLLLFSTYAIAQAPAEEFSDPEPVIEALKDSSATDAAIRTRIKNIYAELDALKGVSVEVKQGVVKLGGEVSNEVAAQQAERLATRLAGVVTVEERINRTLAVRDNVEPVVEKLQTHISNFIKALPLLALAFLVLVLFTLFGGFLARRKVLWQKIAPNPFLAELLAQAVRVVLFLLGAILALDLLSASAVITTVLGGAGVVGLAIGFAVRDTMENYISSIMLSLRQPFRAKDHVVINGHEGVVVRLTSRATILMTLDGNHLRIPNSEVFKGIILNYTTNPDRRFEFDLGVDAEDDPVAAMKTGLDAIRGLEFVLDEPQPSALIVNVGDSNIVIKFMAWVNQDQTDFGKARSLAMRSAMQVLQEQGFTLPEPIYRLRFDPLLNSALESSLHARAPTDSTESLRNKYIETPVRPKVKQTVAEEDDTLDVSPKTYFDQKVEAEIRAEGDSDLLDDGRPRE